MSTYAGAVALFGSAMVLAKDYENGANETGTIAGTTKFRVSSTVTVPIACRVIVFRDVDHQPVRDTLSDAVTGAWSVTGIDKHLTYTALALHPTTAARAVVADGVYPT
jgi:hypothetical protein